MFRQFDIVRLKTTKRVRFMSGPQGSAPNPQGNWSIVGFIEGDAMIAKDSTIVRVPLQDLHPMVSMDVNSIVDKLSNVGYAPITKFDIISRISTVFKISEIESKKLLQNANLPLAVTSEEELEQIIERIKSNLNGQSNRRKK